MRRALLLVPLLAVLTACNLPVATVALPDLSVNLPVTLSLPLTVTTPVIYSAKNLLAGQGGIPGLVNSVGVQGTAEYVGARPIQTLDIYVRQNLTGCFIVSAFAYCGLNEAPEFLGSIHFASGKSTTFTFGNTALLKAAQAGQLYLGVRVTGSGFNAGDQLKFTNLTAVARL